MLKSESETDHKVISCKFQTHGSFNLFYREKLNAKEVETL